MPRRLPLLVLLASLAACGGPVPPAATAPTALPSPGDAPAGTGVRVLNVATADVPAAGTVATTVLHESPTLVSRIMRIAPGGEIAEHHHPGHDETFFVHRGAMTVVLNGREHTARAGDVVHIPAGTVIVGRNPGAEEAVVVVAFAANGRGGPLTVPGAPHH
ncbi:MAG TPA: cupin domain-containing protein [Longimicrobiaceae bacterium]|nr:cupin domain-containing protein [Longimicrobiaceae bacterium]